jgi:hypothetical protein
MFLGLTLLCSACGGEEAKESSETPNVGETRERRFVEAGLEPLWSVGGGEGDTTLLRPRLMVPAPAGGLYVWDDGHGAVLAFDSAGALAWTAGRKGGGPDEFRRVRDMETDDAGNLWVLDPGNSRLSVLSPDGRFLRRVPLAAVGHAEQVAPLSGARAVLLTMDEGEAPFVVVDSAGNAGERFGVGWDGFARLHPLVRQGYTAASGSDRWVYAFTLGDGWFSFDGMARAGTQGRYVEHVAFPRVREVRSGNSVSTELEGYAPCSACSTSLFDGFLFVHFGGFSEQGKRLVDLYEVASGEYRGSLLLPEAVAKVTAGHGRIFTLQQDSATVITARRYAPD